MRKPVNGLTGNYSSHFKDIFGVISNNEFINHLQEHGITKRKKSQSQAQVTSQRVEIPETMDIDGPSETIPST